MLTLSTKAAARRRSWPACRIGTPEDVAFGERVGAGLEQGEFGAEAAALGGVLAHERVAKVVLWGGGWLVLVCPSVVHLSPDHDFWSMLLL